MAPWEFIERAAAELGIGAEAFRKWRIRGVPHQWRLAIADRALAQGYDLDRAEFDRPPGSRRAEPAPEAA